MSDKTVVLYEREKSGIHVVASKSIDRVAIKTVIGEGSDAEVKETGHKNKRTYRIIGTVNGEVISTADGVSYRQTIQAGRNMFKELYEQFGPKVEESDESVDAEPEAV